MGASIAVSGGSGAKLLGDKELIAVFNAFKPSVRRRIARPGVLKGARIVAKAAKAKAPKDRGFLKRSIGVKAVTYSSGTVAGIAGAKAPRGAKSKGKQSKFDKSAKAAGANPAKYAHLVEFGTKPHTIGKGSKLNNKERVGTEGFVDFFGRKRKRGIFEDRAPIQGGTGHPGTAAQPFMRPAFDQNLTKIKAVITKSLKENIEKEIAKRIRKRISVS